MTSQSPAAPQRPSLFGGLMGGLAGFALGGLLGSLLFGGFGHGFGGIGLMDLLLIGGGLFLLFSFLRRRQQTSPQPAYAGGDVGSATSAYGSGRPTDWVPAGGTTVAPEPTAESDLERGIAHIRQMDPTFDPEVFADFARVTFRDVQTAWVGRDVSGLADRLTPEMAAQLRAHCDQLRNARQSNRVERIGIRRAEVSEAWQESGQDFVTVAIAASLIDYTVDDATGALVDGSKTVPQDIEEYWTFARPVGPNLWRLSAIQTS